MILSKPFKTKKLAEKARLNIPTESVGRLESAWFGLTFDRRAVCSPFLFPQAVFTGLAGFIQRLRVRS